MSGSRKRKAIDQLSPYSNLDGDEVLQESLSQPLSDQKKPGARATIKGREIPSIDTESLKGVIANIKILSQEDGKDKLSGLNRCFSNAVARVLKTQTNKDLRYLFKQYEAFVKAIDDENLAK